MVLQASEWYREGACGGGFYSLQVSLLTADGQVRVYMKPVNYNDQITSYLPTATQVTIYKCP